MKHFKNIAIAVMAIALLVSSAIYGREHNEHEQLKRDVKTLLGEMDKDGTIEQYDGSDHVSRLFHLFNEKGRAVR